MPRKKPIFDWSTLDKTNLSNVIWNSDPDILGKHISISKIHSSLSKQIKSHIPIIVRKYFDSKVDPGLIYIGGVYYSDLDKQKKKCIEIQLVYNNPKDEIYLGKYQLKRLSLCFADTVLHEIIHMRQFRRRNFKYLPDYASNAEKTEQRLEQAYLGSSDEIDAYAFNIACDLYNKYKNDTKKIVKYLSEDQKNKKRKFNCWRMYLKAFDHNHNHVIIKRLKKKVIRYLPHAAAGKPYKNKDWINW